MRSSTGSTGSEHSETTPPPCSCTNLAQKFEEISSKLDSVLHQLTEIESLKAAIVNLSVENANLTKSLAFSDRTIQKTTCEGEILKKDNAGLREELNEMKNYQKTLEARSIQLEAYDRRSNMKFFVIAEQENETPSNTEEILREFVKVNLKQPAEMFFESVHHVGPKTAKF